MEIAGETELEERWKKTPQGKPQEWTKAMINDTYKLKCGPDKLAGDREFSDQFFPSTPKAGNDGYKLNKFISKDNEGMAMVVKFLTPILMHEQPS